MSRPTDLRGLRRALGWALCALLPGASAGATPPAPGGSHPGLRQDPPARNAPESDPYTRNDPALLAAAGLVSLGGFEFATTDTAEIDRRLPLADIRWIETAHFEIGFALGPEKPRREDKKKLERELAALRLVLPDVPEKPRSLDPWLRAHLFARRAEAVYARVEEILRVSAADFPAVPGPYDNTKKFMGVGPHLGQGGKYEVLLLPSEGLGNQFLRHYFGLQVFQSQRWNVVDRNTLIAVLVADGGTLDTDAGMHGHLAFNLAINLLDGYKFYAYDLPIWMREGLGHLLEREISPDYNTFDADEGSEGVRTNSSDWLGEVRSLLRKGEAPTLSSLVRMRSYAELDLPRHFACWSMVQYLVEVHGPGFACLLDRLKGLLDERGVPDGSDLLDHHRDGFRDCLGLSYAEFDAAWAQWVGTAEAKALQERTADAE
jgi:hypothetical protein